MLGEAGRQAAAASSRDPAQHGAGDLEVLHRELGVMDAGPHWWALSQHGAVPRVEPGSDDAATPRGAIVLTCGTPGGSRQQRGR
eukprot:COSAG01_NODE_942_length_12551_cov_47.129216_10_plen_84_part_00